MKFTITVEVSDSERRAIASEAIDFRRLKVAPASREMVLAWLKFAIQKALEGTEETWIQGGEK